MGLWNKNLCAAKLSMTNSSYFIDNTKTARPLIMNGQY